MKKNALILFCVFMSFLVVAQPTEKEQKALKILKKYNPEGYYIIEKTTNLPHRYLFDSLYVRLEKNNGFGHFFKGNSTEEIVKNLNTAVHEMTHDYASRVVFIILKERNLQPKEKHLIIYTEKGENILIEESKTFPSVEIVGQIPIHLQTFRFNTYINTDNDMLSTQQSGIYGLLDEFAAYYQGTKTSYDLYDYYFNETGQTNQDLIDYMVQVNSTFYAYLEFKYYILKYLMYAKINYPKTYLEITTNKPFKQAYRKIDRLYAQLIQDYFARNREIAQNLKVNRNISMIFGEEFTMVGNQGISNFRKEYNLLRNELSKQEYVRMEDVLNK